MNITIDKTAASLAQEWAELQKTKPAVRIRDAAQILGVCEVSLLATRVGENIVRLKGSWPELLQRFSTLGRVMSLTRNDSCILEHKGTFQNIDVMGQGAHAMATVIGPIETRVFFNAWYVAFSVIEEKGDRVLRSIQIFDRSGDAITKIYLQDDKDPEFQSASFLNIIKDFYSDDQSPEQVVFTKPVKEYAKEIDKPAFLKDWANLRDTHDFFGMLRKYNVDRYDALVHGEGKFTHPINPATAPKLMLDQAAELKLPIMIFAGNHGNLQIHQGTVRTIRVLEQGPSGDVWLNVLDPEFNMHMKQNEIATAWVVKKPTTDGIVTSIELFDRNKNMIAQFFGLRKPGVAENKIWTALVADLLAAQ